MRFTHDTVRGLRWLCTPCPLFLASIHERGVSSLGSKLLHVLQIGVTERLHVEDVNG